MSERDAFGARLRACRRAAGLSQQELTERSGLSIRAISDLERGRTRWPYRDSVQRLATALRLSGAARAEFTTAAGRRLPEPFTGPAQTAARPAGDLPGTASCAVLVISRNTLARLVARDGAARLDLDLLPLEDSVRLLRKLIAERAADPDTAVTLATCCCQLPLALRVAAELAIARLAG